MFVRVPEKMMETLEAQALSGISLRTLSQAKYQIVFERDRAVRVSGHTVVDENVLHRRT